MARREYTQHNQIDKRKHASASAGRREKPAEAGRRNDHARAERSAAPKRGGQTPEWKRAAKHASTEAGSTSAGRGQRGENPAAKRSGNRVSGEGRRAGEQLQTERTPVVWTASGTAARDWALPVAVTVETEAQLAEVLKHDAVALVYLDEACFTDFAALIRRVHAAGKQAGLRLRRIERDFDASGRKAENSAELLNGFWKAACDAQTTGVPERSAEECAAQSVSSADRGSTAAAEAGSQMSASGKQMSSCFPDALLVRNLDEAMLLEDFFTAHPELKARIRRNFDYTVYGYNQEAMQALVSLGADGLTYPIELTYHECRKLREKLRSSVRGAAGTHSTNAEDAVGTRGTNAEAVVEERTPVPAAARAGADAEADSIGLGELPFELMIYGHLPMMVSANCIQRTSARCDHGNRILQLRDRMGKDMPVRCYCTYCYNQIFNAEPLVLYDLPDEVRALQPQCLRYDFSVEPAAVVRQVLEGAVPRSMTRGHFRHGIE